MIGIIGAMPEEIGRIIEKIENRKTVEKGMRQYHVGELFGQPVVAVFSRWGKVAAATTVTNLILDFDVKQVIFTGVAGALSNRLKVGDIVVGKDLYQHDMDARPLMQQFEIPLLGTTKFTTDKTFTEKCHKASLSFVRNGFTEQVSENELKEFNLSTPEIHIGDIASGDQFISSSAKKNEIISGIPSLLCTEMEGASVAQVCYEYNIPFSIIRIISDEADENANIDFPSFVNKVASKYSLGILEKLIK